MSFTNVCPFWGIFAALQPSFFFLFFFFTIFVMGSEVCMERCDSYGNFGFKNKIEHFYFKRIFVKEHIVLLL